MKENMHDWDPLMYHLDEPLALLHHHDLLGHASLSSCFETTRMHQFTAKRIEIKF